MFTADRLEKKNCECSFDLYSMLHKEQYRMPCSVAAAFLKQLKPAYPVDKGFNVRYTVRDNKHTYTNLMPETPARAAAKITLFIQNPNFLPKSGSDWTLCSLKAE